MPTKLKTVTFYLRPSDVARLDKQATSRDRTRSKLVKRIILRWLARAENATKQEKL